MEKGTSLQEGGGSDPGRGAAAASLLRHPIAPT